MADQKEADVVLDPRAPQFRRKLWVHVQTTDGRRLIVFWARVGALLAGLLLLAWLMLGTAAWGFVRYQRGVAAVRWVDIAFYPLRKAAYRATLGRHHLTTGKAQLEQQKWMEGIMSLRAAVAYAPELTEARRILADFYVAVKQPQQALQYLDGGLPFARDDAAYVDGFFQQCLDGGDLERAVRSANAWLPQAVDSNLLHRRVALRAAEALRRLRRGDECVALVKRWRLEDGAAGQLLLAAVEDDRGDTAAAVQRLEGHLVREPANEAVALELTRIFRRQGRLTEARRITLLRSIARPESPGARIDLLVLDRELGRNEEFANGVDAFLRSFPGDSLALQLLARAAGEKADPDLAARTLAVARDAGHRPVGFLFGLMQAQCGAGRFADALETAQAIDRESDLPPESVAGLSALKCWAFFGHGNQAEGEVWLHRFLTQPDLPLGYTLGLADALANLRIPHAAIRVLQAATERPDAQEAPLRRLALLLVDQQDWQEAKRLLPRLKTLPEPPAETIATIESNLALLGL